MEKEQKTFVQKIKANKKLIAIITPIVTVVLVLAIVLPLVLKGGVNGTVFRIPENKLPTEEKFALTKYDYENLSDVQATVRSDTMNVTKRGLPRTQPQMLSDDFSLVYDEDAKTIDPEYGSLTPSVGAKKTATITFGNYPQPMRNISCDGVNAFTNGTMNGAAVASSNGAFYKYMLMTQGQHLAMDAARRSAETASDEGGVNAAFAQWLKKHPAADGQYGAVLGTDNAVEKEIVLDPIYRSPHASGLYLPAGEPVTVKVEGLKQGERISVTVGYQNSLAWRGGADASVFNSITGGINQVKSNSADNYFTMADVLVANGRMEDGNVTNQSQWNRQHSRAPWIIASFTLNENKTYTIGTAFGGFMHIEMNNCYSQVKTTFTGAVESPHYILGVTTPEYFDEYLRQAPGVIAVLDTENGELIGPAGEMGSSQYMRQVKTEEIDKLAMLWHSFLSVNESFTGGTYNRFNKIMFDWHVPAGAAVSLGNYSFAQPVGWFNDAMNYRGLLQRGTWGTLHEIGHNHANSYGTVWGFATGREGEVRNNALILLSYIMFCDVGTTIRNGGGAEHGMYANPYNVLTETLSFKGRTGDFDDGSYGYFQCLGMYANIMHSFGAEKFYELLYTYKDNSSYVEAGTNGNKRSDFAYRCSLIYGMNFLKYFNEYYCANITDDMFTEAQLAEIKTLPNYEPVSSFYAGGIDGVKTAGDLNVAFGNDITFDLTANTKSTLDFEIIGVSQPEHGKIREQDGKWIYSFDNEYTGTFDNFTFDVRLSDGIIHTLSVTLRISYNGAQISSYKRIEGRTWDNILSEVDARQPDEVMGSVSADIPNYNTDRGTYEVRTSEFYWKAPQSGEVSISFKCDDWGKFYFGESFESLEELGQLSQYIDSFNEYGITRTVEKDKFYAFKIFNVNTGGTGNAAIGVKFGGASYENLNLNDVYHPNFPINKTAETYVYEPQFIVSKKDNIKLSITGTDKSEWSVVSAPENVQDGRKYEEIQYDSTPDSPTYGEEILRIEHDKWDWLIDGQPNTIFHTVWRGAGIKPPTPQNPDVFIIDTAKEQQFNYFTITTRLTQNDDARITSYELLLSSDGENYTPVSVGDSLEYRNVSGTKVANLAFDQVTGRYWKLIVKGTSGRNFTIISELDTGIQSTTQQIVPPTSNKFFATQGWKNSSEIAGEPNGYLIAENKNERVVIKFRGESFAFYAAAGEGYGSAEIIIDGARVGTVDLNSSMTEARKLAFNLQNLEDKEHTVEIITTSSDKFMLNIVGIPYTAELINAPNIYKESSLTIALVVFLLLFAAVTAFVLCLVFIPKFRNIIFGNRFIEKLDNREKKPKKQKTEKVEKVEKAEPVQAEAAKAEKPAKSTKKVKSEKAEKPASSAKAGEKETKSKNTTPKKK